MDDPDPERLDDPWMTLAEIAGELRMSPATIRSWISKGRLQAMRAGQRKWLVRRSELDRMLRGEDFEGAVAPPPDPLWVGDRPRQRRPPDSISSPNTRRWRSDEEHVDPDEWLGVAQWEWLAALQQSRMAPPDAWFIGRLHLLGEAAARKADALSLFAEDCEMRWEEESAERPFTLSYELRPGGNRPGPTELWAEFDGTVERLGRAIEEARAGGLRRALEELSVAVHEIADSLDRYRGRYGNWQELPPDAADEGSGGVE